MMEKITVLSVNVSEKKGTVKQPVPSVTLSSRGIEGDAHSGPWNRQVSMLGIESIRRFEQEAKRPIRFGEFAENITTQGMELWKCRPLDRFETESFALEVTQIGKKCHGDSCTIFREVGNCVMPKEGIFARFIDKRTGGQVLTSRQADKRTGGQVLTSRQADKRTGGQVNEPETWKLKPETILLYKPKILNVHIITLSDRAFRGEYEDRSGPRIRELLPLSIINYPLSITHTLLPDDPDRLKETLTTSISGGADLIFTTGGTGIGPRDFTPDVVKPLLEKEIPGIMEMIRIKYGTAKHQALLSRSMAGVTGNSLIFTLPGSVKAVEEYMEEISQSLLHMILMLHGLDMHS